MVGYGWWNAVVVWWMLGWYAAVLAAPGDHAFQWKFGGNFVATTITECQNLSVVVESLDSNTTAVGVGPYYLFAFEVGGIPTVTMIGTNISNLTWQNTHRGGSSLMLTILDSQQSTGGVSPTIYNVTGGMDRSCLPAISSDMQPPVIPSIISNLTGTVETCQPWGLTISGGAKPYQIVLSALQSTTITNSSMGTDDDVFTYIDRADPNELLMASVVDANGRWGISSNLILPQGSKDVNCTGLVSSSKTSAQIQQEAQARAAAEQEKHNHHQHVAIGVGVGVGVGGLIILLTGLWLFMRWRARRNDGVWDSQDVVPRAWDQQNANADMQERQHTPPPLSASTISNKPAYSPTEPLPETGIPHLSMARVYLDREIEGARVSNTTLTSGSTLIPQTSSTQPISARERKLREASGQHPPSTPSGLQTSTTPPATASSPAFSASTNRVDAGMNRDSVQPDIIIQHRDAGTGIVQELPPPYADRTAPASDAPS